MRKTVPLPGSERRASTGARVTGPVSGDELIEVRITLKAPASLEQKVDELSGQPLAQRKYVSREDFDKAYAVDDATIRKLEQFARDHNLAVSRIDKAQHAVYLTGNARDVSLAFQTYLEYYEQPDGVRYRGRTGALHVPEDLADAILSVNGLDNRPVAKPKMRVYSTDDSQRTPSLNYTPQELAKLYSFPSSPDAGQGQCIAIIELGGGFRQSDLNTYFDQNSPAVTAVSVDRGRNNPTGNVNGPDGEVMLDIEVAGAIAPKAAIAVYFAPNTNKGFLDAISAAVHDAVRKPTVISISWGSAEDGGGYSRSVLNAFDQVFQAAAALGITVLAAAGDNGSSDGLSGDHVDFPASSPHVTGCGGTRLLAPDKKTIQSETVWNDGLRGGATGGGISKVFAVPSFQRGLKVSHADKSTSVLTGRGVPDIAANADPVTGYDVLVDGQRFAIGGTSAVAPLLAGMIAVFNQQIGKPVGLWNPILYSETGTVRDISVGTNGSYAAAQGWDACTGVGAPVGSKMLAALKGQSLKTA